MDEQSLQEQINEIKKQMQSFTVQDHIHNGYDVTRIYIKDLEKVFFKQAVLNPSNLADGAGQTLQVTGVVGATLGDWVLVSAPYDLQDITVTTYVQANDIVEIRLQNESGGAIDLASGIWRILVIKKIV